MMTTDQQATSPAVTLLLEAVVQFNQIAREALADGNKLMAIKSILISAEFLRAARAMQRLHDASEGNR